MGAARRPPRPWMVRLALVDALAIGIAVGFLGRHYRDALVEHAGVISFGVLVVVAAGVLVRLVVRNLRRASGRQDAILVDELPRRPSPAPR
ncbi:MULTISPECIES: hypothetical protein [unclassified Amycolatopsis]|uniref:hypothetical protein n=1 Tax=unclassified Amycolatopsis TaxID=2618356 RepID=UPI001C6991F2|nr:hypothetical protein [Amycolatopsis sp. DSM 110486]QYN21280.1 hypothetical protein K1T34_01545 [Amycolatopsis sp. DSM 110486]